MTPGAQLPRLRARRLRIKALVLAVLLLPAAFVFLLYRPGLQGRLLSAALRRAEEATGLSLSAREISMDPLRGRLALRGVSAAVPGSRPFLTADTVDLELDVGEAVRRRFHVRHVAIEGARIDFGAPLPASQGTSTGDLPFLAKADIDHIRVEISSVDSGPLPETLRGVALGARLEKARLTGSLRGGTLRLSGDFPSVVVERPGPLRLEAKGDLALSATAAGTLGLEAFHLDGEGFSASAWGEAGLSADAPIALRAEVSAEPGRIAPELRTTGLLQLVAKVGGSRSAPTAELELAGQDVRTPDLDLATVAVKARLDAGRLLVESTRAQLRPGGHVGGEGQIDLGGGDGTWTLRAVGLPDGLLSAFADAATRQRWGIAGSRLDGVATVRHGRGDPLPLSVDAELSLARAGTRLAAATAHLESRGSSALDFSATFLPASPGERRAEGILQAPTLAGLASGRLTRGRLLVAVPDLATAHAELRALFPSLVPAAPEGIDLEGALRFDVRVAGPLRTPRADVEAGFTPARGGSLSLRAGVDGARRSVEGTVAVSGLSAASVRPGATGLASADATFALGPKRRDVRVTLDASGLCLAEELPLLETLHATAEAEGQELRILELAAAGGAAPGPGLDSLHVAASGRLSLAEPFRDADLDAVLSAGELSAEAHALLRDGVLALDVPRAGGPDLGAALAARLPLGALRDVPALAAHLPRGLPGGPLELTLDAPGFDSCALEGLLPAGTGLVPFAGDLHLFATIPLADPLGGTAAVELDGAWAETPAGRLAVAGPARLTLRGGRLVLEPVAFEGDRTSFLVSASADLVPGARPGASLSGLFSHVDATARGRADAALLVPFLAGGTATGEIALDARAAGPPDALEGHVLLDGQGSRFSWPLAWPTEIRDPLLEADLKPGSASLTRGEALLNDGPLLLSGGWYGGVGTTLTATFSDVRYRLAYGLATVLSGDLTLDLIEGERRVSGNVTLDRGLLDRNIDLDREILARILAPPEASGTEASLLDTLALDVGIGTASGVRVRNNVADLSATWSRIDVTGTARRPVVRGRVEVERGGLVFAYGQTFRIDQGTVTYAGDPATDPRLEFVTTSSLQDPSIGGRAAAGDVFAESRPQAAGAEGEVDAAAELARGLAGYYGDRLASSLGSALGPVSLSVQPLFLLGETDQAARLTLSRAFSPTVSLAVSVDLKNAQRQTWVVDVHGLRRLPPLAVQVFTEDYDRYGGSLQQRIEIGGTAEDDEEPGALPLAVLRITPPDGVSRRALVSAIGLGRGDLVGRSALFEAEIDAEAFLRSRGWPEAQVTMRAVPAKKAGRVDVEAGIDPGPRVEVVFEGDRLPAASRAAVAGLYRTGPFEESALGEMRLESLRALRALGHLEPDVEVTAGGDEVERRVVVTARAGRKVEIHEVVFDGVTPREAGVLARRFPSLLERIELAAALPSADRRLLEALFGLGYPVGRILERDLEDGGRLVLEVDPGLPSLVESVEVRGVPPDEAERLAGFVRVSPGDPADADRTALSALAIEGALRAAGFAEARVRTSLSPATPEDPPRLAVVFDVAKGTAEDLGSVTFSGLSRTSPAWARSVAALSPGGTFLREEVDRARGELFSLGLFRSVRAETRPGPYGRVDVVLTAEELPPLTLAYGLRWENERGLAAVVDVADRNLFGRGLTLGTRVLYDPDDRAIRAFAGVPERLLGVGLDLWVERRRTFQEGLYAESRTDSTEASIQLSRSLGRSLSARLYGRWKESRYFEDDPFFPLDVTITFPYAGTQLVWDTREDPLLGTRGLLASVDLQGSGSWLGSSFSYARAYGQVNVYHPVFSFGAGRAVWAQSVRAGYARAFDGQELIPDVRFYAGGSYSVRGYPTESLGPREDLGGTLFATGGSTLLVVNEELRVPLHPRLLGVGFFDVGQVWASSSDFGTDLATSVGLGLRALTPLGVLRLDGALPLNRREGDPAWKVTFGFGNVF